MIKLTFLSIWSAMVSGFVLGLPPRDGFWKKVHVTMLKHDPFDDM
jgi:hypothetical protein